MESATPLEAIGLVEAHSFAWHWSRGGSGHHSGIQPVGGQREQLCGDKAEVNNNNIIMWKVLSGENFADFATYFH